MTEAEWLTSTDPMAMLQWLLGSNQAEHVSGRIITSSNRKLRLFACGCCRLRGADAERVDEYERRGYFLDVTWSDLEWARTWCSSEHGRPGPSKEPTHTQRADLLRCIFGNPWRPVKMSVDYFDDSKGNHTHVFEDPAWQTPTVVSIAQNIYDSRDWSAMPVLADALLEAGLPETVECGDCKNGFVGVKCSGCGGDGLSTGPPECRTCRRCDGTGTMSKKFCPSCNGTGRLPHPVLLHLRSGSQHARGCLVIDVLLNLEKMAM